MNGDVQGNIKPANNIYPWAKKAMVGCMRHRIKMIGYFYLYKRCLLGEIHSPDTASLYDGHHHFWTSEAPKFCTLDISLASYGCDRGRVTLQDNQYRLLGTPGVVKNKDKILEIFGFSLEDSVIIISNDDHYKTMKQDTEVLKAYEKYFKIPVGYKYLIGLI